MNNKTIIMLAGLLLITAVSAMSPAPKPVTLALLKQDLSAELNKMDGDLKMLAGRIYAQGLTSEAAANSLQNFYNAHGSVADLSVLDRSGKLILVRPKIYAAKQGTSIRLASYIVRMGNSRRPVLSDPIKTAEGFWSATLGYPVFTPKKRLAGFVIARFKPDALLGNALKPHLGALTSTEVYAIRVDGTYFLPMGRQAKVKGPGEKAAVILHGRTWQLEHYK